MRADADQQVVVGAPADGLGEIEISSREAAGMLADGLAVEPGRGAELCL